MLTPSPNYATLWLYNDDDGDDVFHCLNAVVSFFDAHAS